MIIKIQVLSRLWVEEIKVFPSNTLVISIHTPGVEQPKITGKNVYFWSFYDVDKELYVGYKNPNLTPIIPITLCQAEQIVGTVLNHKHLPIWVISCEAGVSRSPGVALGLATHIATNPGVKELEDKFPCHNKYVKMLIGETMKNKMAEKG